MQQLERIANGVVEHRQVTVLLMFVLVVAVSGGIVFLEHESAMPAFTVGSAEEQALEDIEANFSTAQDDVTVAQIVVEDENALSKGTLVSTLELQQEIRTNESIAPTLVDDRPTVGIANMVATAAIREQSAGPDGAESAAISDLTLDEQIAALEAMDRRDGRGLRLTACFPADAPATHYLHTARPPTSGPWQTPTSRRGSGRWTRR